jgi:hypothetical protein
MCTSFFEFLKLLVVVVHFISSSSQSCWLLLCASSLGAPPKVVGCSYAFTFLSSWRLVIIVCLTSLSFSWSCWLLLCTSFFGSSWNCCLLPCPLNVRAFYFLSCETKFFFNFLSCLLTFFLYNPTCCIYLLCHLNMGDAQINKVVIISRYELLFFSIIICWRSLCVGSYNSPSILHDKSCKYVIWLGALGET